MLCEINIKCKKDVNPLTDSSVLVYFFFVAVCHLDLDAEGDESPIDGEKSHILAQRPKFPALEGKVSIGFLKQHERLEGDHLDGHLAFLLVVRDVGDPVHPPLLPWIKDPF